MDNMELRNDIQVNCCFCGRDLTDAHSQERGYGPICAARYGLLLDTTSTPQADSDALVERAILATSTERRGVAERVRDWRDNRKLAAKRLAWLLSFVTGSAETGAQLKALAALGFTQIAGLIATQRDSDAVVKASKYKATITCVDGRVGVATRWRPKGAAWDALIEIPGRRWHSGRRCNTFPANAWDAVVQWVQTFFPMSEIPERPEWAKGPVSGSNGVKKEVPSAPKKPVVKLALVNHRIAILSPYNFEFVKAVKEMPQRKWLCMECGKPARPKCIDHPDGQHVWTLPLDRLDALKALVKEHYPDAETFVTSALAEVADEQDKRVRAAETIVAPVIKLKGGTLYPFQCAGVRYFEVAKGCAINADEQGLGKTVQAIAYVHRNVRGRTIYVVPANVKYNWALEIAHWLTGSDKTDRKLVRQWRKTGLVERDGITISVISGTPSNENTRRGTPDAQHVIINYDLIKRWLPELKEVKYEAVVADEVQNLKNTKAARTKAFVELIDDGVIDKRVLLTGTPIDNRPKDLWNPLKIIDEQTWGNYFHFHKRYTNATRVWAGKNKGYVWDFNGVNTNNISELHDRLNGHQWIRRLKSDVLPDLPNKLIHEVTLTLPDADQRAYKRVEAQCVKMLPTAQGKIVASKSMTNDERVEVLAQITRLRSTLATAKTNAVRAWVEDLVASVGKVVLFAHHQRIIQALAEALPDSLVIDGNTTAAQRVEHVAAFQSDPEVKIIICSIKAASVGITLTAASHVVLAERTWKPKDHDQAMDRVHRIGQTEQVTVWYLDAPETFDDAMRAVNKWKDAVANGIVDGTGFDEETDALQLALDYFGDRG